MMVLNRLQIAVFLGLTLAVSVGARAFQDEEAQQPDQAVEETETATETPADSTDGPPARRTIYFVGPKVALDRQQGPSVGQPRSILPQPLIRPGSLEVPEPKEVAADPVEELLEQQVNDDLVNEVEATNEDFQQPVDQETTEEQTVAPNPFDPYTPNISADSYDEGSLEQIDPSGISVELGEDGLQTIWQGYERDVIISFLNQLSQPSLSPTLARFASRIAASRFDVPAPANDQSIQQFIAARLGVFEAQANREAYVGLIELLPEDFDWTPLAHHFARAHLLKGELTDACQVADARRANDLDPYWARLSTFCMAAAGNRSGVDFQLGILEETTEVNQVFYQLIDQILVEAEQPPGAVLPPVVKLENPLPADILTASMARLARVTAEDIDVSAVNPLAIPLLLENALLPRLSHSNLISYLMARGVANPDSVAEFVTASEFSEDEKAAFASWLSLQDEEEASDILSEPEQEPLPVDGELLQPLLLQTITSGPSQAPLALQKYWQLAGERNLRPAVASVVSKIVTLPNVETYLNDPVSQAIITRAAYLAGDIELASAWARKLRISVAGQDPDVDAALVGLIPFIEAEEWGGADAHGSLLPLWWAGRSSSAQGYKDANLLFTIQEAFGNPVTDNLWSAVGAGPVLLEGGSVSPAVWRSFLSQIENADPIGAMTSLYRIMSEVAPGDLPPAIAGTLIAGLRQLGFEQAARAFALEILISQKI